MSLHQPQGVLLQLLRSKVGVTLTAHKQDNRLHSL